MTDEEKRNPKLPKLKDLDDAYMKLEEFAHIVKFEFGLSSAVQILRDQYHSTADNKSAHACQLEMEFQSFNFEEGKVRPHHSMQGPEGKEISWPDLANYKDEDLEYLRERLNQSKDSTLRARFANLLWESKLKHIDFAKTAIDSYMDSIRQIRAFELSDPKKSRGHRIKNSIENLWSLSTAVKYRMDDAIELIRDTFLKYDYRNPSSSSVRIFIVDLALSDWKLLGVKLSVDIEDVFIEQRKTNDPLQTMDWLRTLGRVANKVKLAKVQWMPELANTYESIATSMWREKNPAAGEYYGDALEIYRKLKDQPKIVELEKKYDEVKKAMSLGRHEQSLDLTKAAIAAEKYAESIIKGNGKSIFQFLRDNSTLLPEVRRIRAESSEMLEGLALQRDMPRVVLDHRNNPVEHFTSADEIKKGWDLWAYNFHLESSYMLLLRAIFIKGIVANAITPDLLKSYLREETWLSSKCKVWSPAIETDEILADLVVPSLEYFLDQTRKAIEDKAFRPNFILCADSLAVKFEGLLRNLCEEAGHPTFFMRDDKAGRRIVNEQDINWLLYSDPVKAIFSEDQLFFLRFILIEKAGLNWRHKVCHSLSFIPEYNFDLMVQLVMCLLIVARPKR